MSSWTKGKITQACFLDVSAAFDKCLVNGILAKLDKIKDNDSCYDLFKSNLTNRNICTVIDGCKSDVLEITAGVPLVCLLGLCSGLYL
jgi:hypothetical protein